MKKLFWFAVFLFLVNSCEGQKSNSSDTSADLVRRPVFADKFYPGDSTKLTNAIKAFLNEARPRAIDTLMAIIVPHAGYIFAGQIIADAYNQVKENEYDVIVVLGTNHTTAGFEEIGVYPKGAFATPIGMSVIDNKLADELMKEDADVVTNLAVHAQEHSIEVQLPFIEYLFPRAKILPLIVGSPDIDMCAKFGKVLAGVLKGKRALIVASSDLSHYPGFDDAIKVDNTTLKTIARMDITEIKSEMEGQLDRNIPQLVTCACGEAPILAAVAAAKALSADRASIVSYTNSGYTPAGAADRVVGYGAVVLGKGSASTMVDSGSIVVDSSYVLSSSDKRSLLKYARQTLERIFSTSTVPLPRDFNPLLNLKRGAFVTLNKNGELRGCIGTMTEDRPLSTLVGAMALQAAFNDPRFNPLTEQELSQVEIEISVLTPYKQVDSADDIVLGRDGVIIRKGDKQGVFLPQVATETGWSKEVFLDELCHKAGLQAGDWKTAQLFTFQAVVFSESQIR